MKNTTDKKEGRSSVQGEPGNEYNRQQTRTGSVDKGYDIGNSKGSKVDSGSSLKKGNAIDDDDADEMDDDLS